MQAWISESGLKETPAAAKYVEIHQKLTDNFNAATESYPQRQKLYNDSLKIWNTEVGNAYNETIKQWNADIAQAKAANQQLPIRPKPSARLIQMPPLLPQPAPVKNKPPNFLQRRRSQDIVEISLLRFSGALDTF